MENNEGIKERRMKKMNALDLIRFWKPVRSEGRGRKIKNEGMKKKGNPPEVGQALMTQIKRI